MVAFKAMDNIDAKQRACQQPEASPQIIFMENGTLNVLFFFIFLSTSLCFYLLLRCMLLVFVMNSDFEISGILLATPLIKPSNLKGKADVLLLVVCAIPACLHLKRKV